MACYGEGVGMAIEKTDKIWHNGKLIPWDEATIHVMSHVIHYGSSVFEGIRCYALPTGPAIFRAQEHIERLVNSAKVYRIDLDFTREEIVKGMVETIAHNAVWPCYIRPIVLRGYGEAGVNPFNSPTEIYIINYPWGKYLGGESEGCDVCVSSWTRLAPNTLPAMAKAGANYMNSQLMKMEAIVNGYARSASEKAQPARSPRRSKKSSTPSSTGKRPTVTTGSLPCQCAANSPSACSRLSISWQLTHS
jgi:branched-chain amino acid aminotransferase